MMGSFWCPTQQLTELADLSFVKSYKKFVRKGMKKKNIRPLVGCMPVVQSSVMMTFLWGFFRRIENPRVAFIYVFFYVFLFIYERIDINRTLINIDMMTSMVHAQRCNVEGVCVGQNNRQNFVNPLESRTKSSCVPYG
jgi:hypothetical protein